MCGIAGTFAYGADAAPVDEAELVRMRERMRVRGPDWAANWFSPDRRVGLAHRRLAIIDLSPDGAQPMSTAEGRFHITFNGEIYNYRELRAELVGQGVSFRTGSDTEVILRLYERHGAEGCARLRGMFAFAIWDSVERTLVLARDPFGIKPLYLHDRNGTLRFASQVKALLESRDIPRRDEPAGHVGFWIWGHVPEPWTLFEGIAGLPPGTWLSIDAGGRRREGCFDSVERMLSPNPSVEEGGVPRSSLREVLLDSVRHHLVADVPVGVFLSAGIDSTTLTALATECGAALRTVTVGFEEYRGKPEDETPLAEQVARLYGTRHETVWIRRSEFEGARDEFLDAMDQPSTDGLNTWLVARVAAAAGLKVAISGLGGDEFFGGYPSFRHVPRMRSLSRAAGGSRAVGRVLRKAISPLLRHVTSEKYAGVLEHGTTWEGAYLLRRATRMPWELSRLPRLDADFLATGFERLRASERTDADLETFGPPRAIVSWLETTRYMRARLLRDSDWAGMAHSLEIRVPLVDTRLARHVAQRIRGLAPYSKADLAACAVPTLPGEVTRRPKSGFTVPIRDWMLEAQGAAASQRGLRAWQAAVATAFAPAVAAS